MASDFDRFVNRAVNRKAAIVATAQEEIPEDARYVLTEHRLAVGDAKASLEHSRNAGERLLKAKRKVPYGQWEQWVARNLKGVKLRTVQRYIRLAEQWDAIEAASGDDCEPTSVRGALALVSAEVEVGTDAKGDTVSPLASVPTLANEPEPVAQAAPPEPERPLAKPVRLVRPAPKPQSAPPESPPPVPPEEHERASLEARIGRLTDGMARMPLSDLRAVVEGLERVIEGLAARN